MVPSNRGRERDGSKKGKKEFIKEMKDEKTLADVRLEIDEVDDALKNAFLARMELVEQVKAIKARIGGAVYNPDRENEMIRRLTADVEPRFQESYIRFLKEILAISKDYQKQI